MVKRFLDILLSFIALTILSPLLLIVALLIKLDSKGPIVFVQRRVGVNDREFIMYKFRTMAVGTPNVATDKLTNSQAYITNIGFYLRKYSIDELPQLFNILFGNMAIIGPRPALYNQYDLREARSKLGIDKIRPGLSGWAQINGRDDIALDEKVALDYYYLQHQSFLLDCRIILGTFLSVVGGTGATVQEKIAKEKRNLQ